MESTATAALPATVAAMAAQTRILTGGAHAIQPNVSNYSTSSSSTSLAAIAASAALPAMLRSFAAGGSDNIRAYATLRATMLRQRQELLVQAARLSNNSIIDGDPKMTTSAIVKKNVIAATAVAGHGTGNASRKCRGRIGAGPRQLYPALTTTTAAGHARTTTHPAAAAAAVVGGQAPPNFNTGGGGPAFPSSPHQTPRVLRQFRDPLLRVVLRADCGWTWARRPRVLLALESMAPARLVSGGTASVSMGQ